MLCLSLFVSCLFFVSLLFTYYHWLLLRIWDMNGIVCPSLSHLSGLMQNWDISIPMHWRYHSLAPSHGFVTWLRCRYVRICCWCGRGDDNACAIDKPLVDQNQTSIAAVRRGICPQQKTTACWLLTFWDHPVRCHYNSFLPNPRNGSPIAQPWGWGLECLLWAQSHIYVLLLSLHRSVWYYDTLDHVILAPDCNQCNFWNAIYWLCTIIHVM